MELQTRTLMVIPEPTHSEEILDTKMCKVQLRNIAHARLRESRNKVLEFLAADAAINNLDAALKIPDLQNIIEKADLEIQEPLQSILTRNVSSKHNTKMWSYQDRTLYLLKHRGNSFSIIRGQCQKVVIDKMKFDPDWEILEQYGYTLLIQVVETNVLF